MVLVKSPVDHEELIRILKNHGCIIKDEISTIRILSQVDYYRISAYFLPFKQENGRYRQGTSFEQVYRIYEFDRRLRNILYGALETIEIALRTRLAYFFSLKYGSLGYLDSNNFNAHHQSDKFNENIRREIERHRNIPFVRHHLEKYEGNFPLWVLMELFTFGMLSYFYSDLKTSDQKQIAGIYGANYADVRSWLRCCTDIRNICAHYGRLYYRVFSATPAGLPVSINAKRRLWGAVLVIKALYPDQDKWNREVMQEMKKLFDQYADSISLYHIAFPENWFSILNNE
jgi:abortive infection bacteriophage resistance protein